MYKSSCHLIKSHAHASRTTLIRALEHTLALSFSNAWTHDDDEKAKGFYLWACIAGNGYSQNKYNFDSVCSPLYFLLFLLLCLIQLHSTTWRPSGHLACNLFIIVLKKYRSVCDHFFIKQMNSKLTVLIYRLDGLYDQKLIVSLQSSITYAYFCVLNSNEIWLFFSITPVDNKAEEWHGTWKKINYMIDTHSYEMLESLRRKLMFEGVYTELERIIKNQELPIKANNGKCCALL